MFRKLTLISFILLACFTLVACNQNPSNNSEKPNPMEGSGSSTKPESTEKQPTESSYTVNEFADATISNISVSESVITLEVTYTGDHQLNLGKWFAIEVYENGKWYTLPYKTEITWTQEAYPVEPNQSKTMKYDWTHAYNPLSAGKYRIIINAIDFVETGNYTKHNLAAEFEIK